MISMTELVPVIREVVASGGEFNLFTRGTSMRPTIREGVNSVMLGAANEISAGDILLYERKTGEFVLHRLIRARGDILTMCGDNQFLLERGVERSSVIAKVTVILEGDKAINVNKSLQFRCKLALKRTERRAKSIARRIIKKI